MWSEQAQLPFIKIVNSFKALSHSYGPAQRHNVETEFFFDLIQYVDRIFSFPIQFVHKDNNGHLAHLAHAHEILRLLFHPFSHIDYHDSTVYRRECPIGVFSKVFVTRGIQNIDFTTLIVECHY